MQFCFINAKIISEVMLTYNIVENNILHHALYLQPLEKYGTLFFMRSFCFFFYSFFYKISKVLQT